MTTRLVTALSTLLVFAGLSLAQAPPSDPIQSLLVSPDVLLENRDRLGLSDEQVHAIRARFEDASPQGHELEDKMSVAMAKLVELLSADKVNADAALAQLEEVLAIEKQQRRLHMRLMIQTRNELTADQRQMASQLQPAGRSDDGRETRLRTKLAKIQDEIQARAAAGQPPRDVIELMQKFPELMQNGRLDDAEALLARALRALDGGGAQRPGNAGDPNRLPAQLTGKIQRLQERAQQLQQQGGDVTAIQDVMKKIPQLIQQGKVDEAVQLIDETLQKDEQTSSRPATPVEELAGDVELLAPDALREQVAALNKEDVSWRQIAWKTCLLEGLQASREQNKPIMLWIFIDRPIDDERC
jgi:Spy/CpxP family protein refolding chaperone